MIYALKCDIHTHAPSGIHLHLAFQKLFDNCLSFLKSSQLRTESVVEFRGSEVTPAWLGPNKKKPFTAY